MFSLTLFVIAAIVIGFFGGTFWLAAVVSGAVFAKLFPMVTILIVLTAVGLVAFRYYWKQ
jgi:hypothetical protein